MLLSRWHQRRLITLYILVSTRPERIVSPVTKIQAFAELVTIAMSLFILPRISKSIVTKCAWQYHSYDGGMKLLTVKDLRIKGIECPMTSLEEWIRKQDWSGVLDK